MHLARSDTFTSKADAAGRMKCLIVAIRGLLMTHINLKTMAQLKAWRGKDLSCHYGTTYWHTIFSVFSVCVHLLAWYLCLCRSFPMGRVPALSVSIPTSSLEGNSLLNTTVMVPPSDFTIFTLESPWHSVRIMLVTLKDTFQNFSGSVLLVRDIVQASSIWHLSPDGNFFPQALLGHAPRPEIVLQSQQTRGTTPP